jgi:hypothetical protein
VSVVIRAGYATAAPARAGVEERKIANVTRHKNLPPSCAATSGLRRRSTDVGEVL